MTNKHDNYEILNLIGYGLSKFNDDFLHEFNFSTKTEFYNYCVSNKVADTTSTIKNRMDLFDPFFPNNGRKGWWQKGDAYIHRKILIDNLFGQENVQSYSNMIKIYLKESFNVDIFDCKIQPIIKSRFKKLQETGLEAELYFMNNFHTIDIFKTGLLEDARLFGDGYDFQINVNSIDYLAEVKGIREKKGRFRMTENEYNKAMEYGSEYIITIVLNMNEIPRFLTIDNPVKNLKFDEKVINSRFIKEYHLRHAIC